MASKRWDIFGIGTSAVDDLVYVDRFPQPDEKLAIRTRQRQGGGQTATALVAAARHGARTAYCGRLSDDELSCFTLQALEVEGVDCSPVIRSPGCRPYHAIVIVDASTGSRTILYQSEGVREPEPEDILPQWIESSRLVFFDQNFPRSGLQAARLAREMHVPVIADLEKCSLPNLDQLLATVDHLIVSQDFARQVTGLMDPQAMVQKLAAANRKACVVTCGSDGGWYAEYDGPVRQYPAFSVETVDTTGCGDVFHGAYAAAIARGESVTRGVEIASATAAIKATQPGGRAGIPSLAAVIEFLRSQANRD